MIPERDLSLFMANLPRSRRVLRTAMWDAIRKAFPGLGTAVDWPARLSAILNALESDGRISLPKSKKKYSGAPPLPDWLTRNDIEKPVKERLEGHIWAPELSFLSSLPLEVDNDWLILDRWLKDGGREMEPVPLRERSLEIFNDEKKFDGFIRRTPFKTGQVSLAEFRCFYVSEPIAWEQGPDGARNKPGIVIENSNTYYTFCQFNKMTGTYGYVAYGTGSAFTATQEGAGDLAAGLGHTSILYFGDIDWKGFEIPSCAAKKLTERGIQLHLDTWLYKLLIAVRKGCKPISGGQSKPMTLDMEKLMQEDLLLEIKAILSVGHRLPQEGVRLSHLLQAAHK